MPRLPFFVDHLKHNMRVHVSVSACQHVSVSVSNNVSFRVSVPCCSVQTLTNPNKPIDTSTSIIKTLYEYSPGARRRGLPVPTVEGRTAWTHTCSRDDSPSHS